MLIKLIIKFDLKIIKTLNLKFLNYYNFKID